MSLKDLRGKYLAGSISKHDYVSGLMGVMASLEDIRSFMNNSDLSSVVLRTGGGGITCGFKSVPIKMFVDVHDKTSPAVQALGFHDVEGDYSRKLIQAIGQCRVFFDVGANAGYYSLICSRTNPEAEIYSFEPIPSTFMKFMRNSALNMCINIRPYNFGLSDTEGTQEMYFDAGESGAGSLRDIRGNAPVRETARFMRLDDFVEKYGVVPDVMKIDVEGAELFVLKGGIKTLKENSPIIFIEILRKWCRAFGHEAADVFALLHELGYTGHVVRGEGLEVIEAMREDTLDTNFVFKKEEK